MPAAISAFASVISALIALVAVSITAYKVFNENSINYNARSVIKEIEIYTARMLEANQKALKESWMEFFGNLYHRGYWRDYEHRDSELGDLHKRVASLEWELKSLTQKFESTLKKSESARKKLGAPDASR